MFDRQSELKNNIDWDKFQHSNIMDIFVKRKLSLLTLNLPVDQIP